MKKPGSKSKQKKQEQTNKQNMHVIFQQPNHKNNSNYKNNQFSQYYNNQNHFQQTSKHYNTPNSKAQPNDKSNSNYQSQRKSNNKIRQAKQLLAKRLKQVTSLQSQSNNKNAQNSYKQTSKQQPNNIKSSKTINITTKNQQNINKNIKKQPIIDKIQQFKKQEPKLQDKSKKQKQTSPQNSKNFNPISKLNTKPFIRSKTCQQMRKQYSAKKQRKRNNSACKFNTPNTNYAHDYSTNSGIKANNPHHSQAQNNRNIQFSSGNTNSNYQHYQTQNTMQTQLSQSRSNKNKYPKKRSQTGVIINQEEEQRQQEIYTQQFSLNPIYENSNNEVHIASKQINNSKGCHTKLRQQKFGQRSQFQKPLTKQLLKYPFKISTVYNKNIQNHLASQDYHNDQSQQNFTPKLQRYPVNKIPQPHDAHYQYRFQSQNAYQFIQNKRPSCILQQSSELQNSTGYNQNKHIVLNKKNSSRSFGNNSVRYMGNHDHVKEQSLSSDQQDRQIDEQVNEQQYQEYQYRIKQNSPFDSAQNSPLRVHPPHQMYFPQNINSQFINDLQLTNTILIQKLKIKQQQIQQIHNNYVKVKNQLTFIKGKSQNQPYKNSNKIQYKEGYNFQKQKKQYNDNYLTSFNHQDVNYSSQDGDRYLDQQYKLSLSPDQDQGGQNFIKPDYRQQQNKFSAQFYHPGIEQQLCRQRQVVSQQYSSIQQSGSFNLPLSKIPIQNTNNNDLPQEMYIRTPFPKRKQLFSSDLSQKVSEQFQSEDLNSRAKKDNQSLVIHKQTFKKSRFNNRAGSNDNHRPQYKRDSLVDQLNEQIQKSQSHQKIYMGSSDIIKSSKQFENGSKVLSHKHSSSKQQSFLLISPYGKNPSSLDFSQDNQPSNSKNNNKQFSISKQGSGKKQSEMFGYYNKYKAAIQMNTPSKQSQRQYIVSQRQSFELPSSRKINYYLTPQKDQNNIKTPSSHTNSLNKNIHSSNSIEKPRFSYTNSNKNEVQGQYKQQQGLFSKAFQKIKNSTNKKLQQYPPVYSNQKSISKAQIQITNEFTHHSQQPDRRVLSQTKQLIRPQIKDRKSNIKLNCINKFIEHQNYQQPRVQNETQIYFNVNSNSRLNLPKIQQMPKFLQQSNQRRTEKNCLK